ncbi:MAG: DUF4012 domain-containing protein [Patescibacteria group bacterium]
MTPPPPHVVHEAVPDGALAHIDAQDELMAGPLREFLSSQGCTVTVNAKSPFPAAYHIVIGGADFVKELLDGMRYPPEKRIAIVWDTIPDITALAGDTRTKLVRIDPRPLTDSDVASIFSFFFTSSKKLLDLRTLPTASVSVAPPQKILSSGDEERVGGLIRELFEEPVKPLRQEKRKLRRIPMVAGLVLGIFCMILFPFVWFSLGVGVSAGLFGYSAGLWKKGDAVWATRAATAGFYWVKQAEWALGILAVPMRLVGLDSQVRAPERAVSFLSDVGLGLTGLTNVASDAREAAAAILRTDPTPAGVSPVAVVGRLRTSIARVQNHFSLAQSQLAILIRDQAFPFPVEKALAAARQNLSFAEQLLALYPAVAGFRTKQTYLVLLQNSMELRPGGGFIGSIMQISVDGGKITDMSVQDVYAIDGQLKGHVDPPMAVKELLTQEHWYLRDSNWDPDFRVSGERAAWFYQKETGIVPDGVIAVSLPFLTDLLRVTGPLTLSDYADRITADNFFGKAVFYTQSDFFPGSTQKKDFLGSVTRALLSAITSDRKISAPLLFKAASTSVARRNLQFYFSHPETQSLIERFGWAGSVYANAGCAGLDTASCLFDPLLISEANVSVNKANAFVKRSGLRTVVFSEDGTMKETLTLTYRNPSLGTPGDAGGSYRAYVQMVVPADAMDFDVLVDGTAAANRSTKNRSAPVPYWETLGDTKRNSIGVALDVPAGGQAQLLVSYRRGVALVFDKKNGAVYEAFEQKQAGTGDESRQLVVRYPIFWQGNDIGDGLKPTVGFLAKEAQLTYNSTIPTDQMVRIQFNK